jgi:copper resistance protein C
MKALFLSILAAFLLFVPNAAAHTYLDTTNPEDGTTITTPLQTIELKYSGQIEEGSTFSVKGASGSEFKPDNVTVENGVILGTFTEALPNDTYTVSWNSISEDGHPLSGKFSFTVNTPINDATEENTVVGEAKEQSDDVTEVPDTNEEETATNSNSPLLIVGGILVVIIVISLVTLMKRKRK